MDSRFNGRAVARSWTEQPYHDDLTQMQGLLMEARSRTDDWHYEHVGELLWWYFMIACHLSPADHIRLWHNDFGSLVAFAMLGEDSALDLQVLPEYEATAIGAEAVQWAQMRLDELRATVPDSWPRPLMCGTQESNEERIAFLEWHGFRAGAWAEVSMLCDLSDSLPDPSLPTGFSLRSAADGFDITDRAGAQRDVWQPWPVGNVSAEEYALMMRLPGYQPDLDVVAVAPDGAIAAYVNGWIDPVNRIGEFGPVGAREAYRRRGLTRAVLLEALRRMKKHGMNRVYLTTGVSNVPARGLYSSVGFRVLNTYREYERVE